MKTIEERVSIVEDAIVRIEGRFDGLATKVDQNHQVVMGAIAEQTEAHAEAHAAQMKVLQSMKNLGRSANY